MADEQLPLPLPITATNALDAQIPAHIRTNPKFVALAMTYEYGLPLTKNKDRFDAEMRNVQRACAAQLDAAHHMRSLQQLFETHGDLLANWYMRCAICEAYDVNPTSSDSFYRLCELKHGCACSADKAICPTCFTKQLKALKWRAEGKPSVKFECPLCRHGIEYALPIAARAEKRSRTERDAGDCDTERACKTLVPVTTYDDSSVYETIYSESESERESESESESSEAEAESEDEPESDDLNDTINRNGLFLREIRMFEDTLVSHSIETIDDYFRYIRRLYDINACPKTWPNWIQPGHTSVDQVEATLRTKINIFTSNGTVLIPEAEDEEYSLPTNLDTSIGMLEDWIIATQPPTAFNYNFVLGKIRLADPVDPIGAFINEDGNNYQAVYKGALLEMFKKKQPLVGGKTRWIDADLECFFKLIHDKICTETIVDEELFKKLCQSRFPLSSRNYSSHDLLNSILEPDFRKHNPIDLNSMMEYHAHNLPACARIDDVPKLREMLDTFEWALYLAYLRECVFKFEITPST